MGTSPNNNYKYGLKYGNENEYKFKRLNIYIYMITRKIRKNMK